MVEFIIWLFFWPLILGLRFLLWLEEIGVPYEVFGILYAAGAMSFALLLLWLDRRDDGEKLPRAFVRSWGIVTLTTMAAVFALIRMCMYFASAADGIGMLCGAFALMLPILVGCLWFLIAFLGELSGIRKITVICILTAVLIPVFFGGGVHFGGMAELCEMRENAVLYTGVVVDCAMSERGAYIGVDLDDGGGACFYEVYGAPFPDGIAVGDHVRISAHDDCALTVEKTE